MDEENVFCKSLVKKNVYTVVDVYSKSKYVFIRKNELIKDVIDKINSNLASDNDYDKGISKDNIDLLIVYLEKITYNVKKVDDLSKILSNSTMIVDEWLNLDESI